jgi:hypothetical protein
VSEGEAGPGTWESVAEVQDVYEAELIAGRLRAAGLEASVVDKSFRQEPIPSVRSFAVVRVFVPRDQAPAARDVLSSASPGPGDAESEER